MCNCLARPATGISASQDSRSGLRGGPRALILARHGATNALGAWKFIATSAVWRAACPKKWKRCFLLPIRKCSDYNEVSSVAKSWFGQTQTVLTPTPSFGVDAVSLPDDEIRDPQDNPEPNEAEEGLTEDLPGSFSGLEADVSDESLFDSELFGAAGVADESPVGDDTDLAAATAGETDETLEFAAPAEMESGIGFEAMAPTGEAGEESESSIDESEPSADGFLAGLADGAGDFAIEGAEEGSDEGEEETDETQRKQPGKRIQRLVAAVGGTDPYTVLMGIALLALLFGILFFYLELATYDFDIGAEKAKQLVGSLGLGWLL